MLRADNVICGTSSTGTGTLSLAACPGPPGGLDFDKWLKSTGLNFVSGNAILVSYTIIEYTSSAFTTIKQTEKGIGTLTLGAAIANATLARTTVQSKVTGMDTSTPSPTFAAPTAITIGTAANTLVLIGGSALDALPSFGAYPYDPNSSGIAPLGMGPGAQMQALVNGQVAYVPFYWHLPMLVKTMLAGLFTTYTGGTSSCYGAIYAPKTTGEPGKLLIDFGALGPANPLNQGNFSALKSASHANGFLLTPGAYWAAIFTAFSGGSGTPTLMGYANGNGAPNSNAGQWLMGMSAGNGFGTNMSWAGGAATANPAPDPANLTSLFAYAVNGGSPIGPMFTLGA